MKAMVLKGVEETVFYEKMKNGLEVFLLPNPHVKNFYMTFNTKFGSIHTEFRKANAKNYTKIPNGVAHFLEHLAFKMKDGDASDYFASLGSFANAYTSYRVTCYEVFGFDKFKENLDYLLDFVQTPYFNAKMVEAEKGIITEEIKMYEDDAEAVLSFDMNRALFQKDNRKYMVSGEVEDIKKITLKDIENAYNTFYHPSNMFVIITGNFNVEEALAIIEENQSKKKFSSPFEIKIKSVNEPYPVKSDYVEHSANIEIEKINIGLKIPLQEFKNLKVKEGERNVYISVILNAMFGVSSEIRERLISGNIITDGLDIDRFFTKDYLIVQLLAESSYPKRYISLMKETIKSMNITEEELERKKKVAISNYIQAFDDIEQVNMMIQSDIINSKKINVDLFDTYQKLDWNIAKKIAKKLIDKNIAVVVLNPKNNETEEKSTK